MFYDSLGLEINPSKSKVMIFNARGLKLDKVPDHQFFIGNNHVEVVNTYQYLGINLKPSGSMHYAVSELADKASRDGSQYRMFYTNIRGCLSHVLFSCLIA